MSSNRMPTSQQVFLHVMLQRSVAQINNKPALELPQPVEKKKDFQPQHEKHAHTKSKHEVHQPAARGMGNRK